MMNNVKRRILSLWAVWCDEKKRYACNSRALEGGLWKHFLGKQSLLVSCDVTQIITFAAARSRSLHASIFFSDYLNRR